MPTLNYRSTDSRRKSGRGFYDRVVIMTIFSFPILRFVINNGVIQYFIVYVYQNSPITAFSTEQIAAENVFCGDFVLSLFKVVKVLNDPNDLGVAEPLPHRAGTDIPRPKESCA